MQPQTFPETEPRDTTADLSRAKLATRLAFFIAGFGLACWAPMVPYAKARIGASHAELGSVLLCLGLGSILGMPATGPLTSRFGSKTAIVAGCIGLMLALPMLALARNAIELGAALFLFGVSLGAIDVAANVHGTEVQKRAGVPLMSGFHGLYSMGGLLGAGAMTAALSLGLSPLSCAVLSSAVVLLCVAFAAPRFLATRTHGNPSVFVIPHGIVVLLGVMAMLVFLVEGAVLDWGAVLLAEAKHVPMQNTGAGYAAFALAMTAARFVGDRFVAAAGNRLALLSGALLTGLGVVIAVCSEGFGWTLCGFAITGLGAANIVPVLFTLAGTQTFMPTGPAIAATSTLGYMGVFIGPAAIGHLAGLTGLAGAFGALAGLMAIVAALSGMVVKKASANTTGSLPISFSPDPERTS